MRGRDRGHASVPSFFMRGKRCRMAYDFKKECKELYLPSKKPGIITKSISAMSAKSYPKS
ncbi:hypothetical protein HMPREF0762_00808 [Slackia exigua ATCC 700122]|uniref:Uncharacterized protein n=1 Tax=Slackia exigua (strain ATCC 700122 / DSM 15923 / CIP 105133 / JCM 11022 / KCTC 5966 / S-7) TaxID=649764 RepID=D0WG57_SLAES|nr:hypothetical protein HMPREF0762_00808 [Slackia exigua ATCC 700122]